MCIFDLKDEPEHICQLAAWHHAEWSYLNPRGSVEERVEKMRDYLTDAAVPSTYIYKYEEVLVGSAAIIKNDMETHPEFTPWLASVFVKPIARNKGVGSKLVKHIIQKAKLTGIKTLYLFTPDKTHFYSKLGWSTLSKEKYRGFDVSIMKVELND